jgi:hypothetical protein
MGHVVITVVMMSMALSLVLFGQACNGLDDPVHRRELRGAWIATVGKSSITSIHHHHHHHASMAQ